MSTAFREVINLLAGICDPLELGSDETAGICDPLVVGSDATAVECNCIKWTCWSSNLLNCNICCFKTNLA